MLPGGTIKLTNGASNVLFADANGNVGIGTTQPMAKLEVNGTILYNGVVAQLVRLNGGTIAANGRTPIYWEYSNKWTKEVGIFAGNGTPITFSYPGTYLISLCFRPGVAGDVWTTCGLRTPSNVAVGLSHGTGNQGPSDPATLSFIYMATIIDTSITYEIYIERFNASMVITTAYNDIAYNVPTFLSTIVRIG